MIASANQRNGTEKSAAGATSPRASSPGDQSGAPDQHPLDPLLKQVAMLREFALHYIAAQKDAVKATIRHLAIKAVLGIGGAAIAFTFVIASTVMLADGLAEFISWAFDTRPWVGKLAVGGGVLLIVGIGATIFMARLKRTPRERTIRKYESRHNAQRAKFGADITQRAAL